MAFAISGRNGPMDPYRHEASMLQRAVVVSGRTLGRKTKGVVSTERVS